jgi:predicted nucleotidyltransferase
MAIRSPLHAASRREAPEEVVVAPFRERVLAALGGDIERIVLFGSRPRGDKHAESDCDFAIFFDHAQPSRRSGSSPISLGRAG